MKLMLASAFLLLGCSAPSSRPADQSPVVILGNKTTPAKCECVEAKREAAKWREYAKKLEAALEIRDGGSSK